MLEHQWGLDRSDEAFDLRLRGKCVCGWRSQWYIDDYERARRQTLNDFHFHLREEQVATRYAPGDRVAARKNLTWHGLRLRMGDLARVVAPVAHFDDGRTGYIITTTQEGHVVEWPSVWGDELEGVV